MDTVLTIFLVIMGQVLSTESTNSGLCMVSTSSDCLWIQRDTKKEKENHKGVPTRRPLLFRLLLFTLTICALQYIALS